MAMQEHHLRTMYKVQTPSPLQFQYIHQHQRGFIIGGGPSLNTLDASDVTILAKDEITFGVNKAYKLFTPTYLIFSDVYFWRHFEHEVNKVDCIKFVPDNVARGHRGKKFVTVRRSSNPADLLPSSLDLISFINNSGVGALRIAYAMGCNPIYLLGIDLGSNQAGETHFHHDYKRDPKRITNPECYREFLTVFENTIKAMQDKGVDIISCSSVYPLNKLISYIPIKDVLKQFSRLGD